MKFKIINQEFKKGGRETSELIVNMPRIVNPITQKYRIADKYRSLKKFIGSRNSLLEQLYANTTEIEISKIIVPLASNTNSYLKGEHKYDSII